MKLAKIYEPNQYEPNIYAMWEKSGAFNPSNKSEGEPYCIIMPPPNANGNLHLGHALGNAVQDILIRYWRMKNRPVVYIPGADHAGFETWVVYERALTEKGISRFDFSREQLYSKVWDFVQEQRGNMELQLRALGASCNWNSLVFTLDEKVVRTAFDTFKKMWDEGLIYRGERIVNFCTQHQTSFADIEVSYKNEKSKLWKIAYPYSDGKGEIVIATTRPETILGDVAIAVNPKDERYTDVIGKTVMLPLTNREIPVIADDYVDMTFGTGALKITPAHDPNDFEIGGRHNLPVISVIDIDGTMINVPDEFIELDVVAARQKALNMLEDAGLRRGEDNIEHPVGHCYKCSTIIEPLVKDQWFIRIQPLAQRAKQAIEAGEINFIPKSGKKLLLDYYSKLRDWNLSRQIPWGIPIPAFQSVDDPNDWIYDERVDQKELEINGKVYKREEDTFDTWFSSGQWPFITTDYLNGGELAKFYPNSVMETGGDILYAWVARMIMMGLYATNKVPFKDVYLHGLVLDASGKKMSKSKNNVINPMDAITEYGSDALRIGLIANRSAKQNQAFSIDRVVSGRNFCNKFWNIARFTEDKVGEKPTEMAPMPTTIADHWIIGRINSASAEIAKRIEQYRFAEGLETMYHAIWDDVADWYIEASKFSDNSSVLAWVLDCVLRFSHPFAPFLTETIWQTLDWSEQLLIESAWPKQIEYDEIAAGEFERLKKLVTEIRFVTSELPGNTKYNLLYMDDSLIADNADLIKRIAKLGEVKLTDTPKGLRLANSGREAWIELSAETLYEHQTNLEVRLTEVNQQIKNLESRLSNDAYIKKAPAKLVEESKMLLSQRIDLRERLLGELEVIK